MNFTKTSQEKIVKELKNEVICPFFDKCKHYYCKDVFGIIKIFCIKNPKRCAVYNFTFKGE